MRSRYGKHWALCCNWRHVNARRPAQSALSSAASVRPSVNLNSPTTPGGSRVPARLRCRRVCLCVRNPGVARRCCSSSPTCCPRVICSTRFANCAASRAATLSACSKRSAANAPARSRSCRKASEARTRPKPGLRRVHACRSAQGSGESACEHSAAAGARCPAVVARGGAEQEIPVRYDGKKLWLPQHGAPSTHILKPALQPEAEYPDAVLNEASCLRFAAALGLNVSATTVLTDPEPMLLIARYDRVVDDKKIRRLHQLDMCQLTGILPDQKYESEGGPGISDMFAQVDAHSASPALDRLALVDWLLCNFLIGNADAHAKNVAMLYGDDGRLHLAPTYDLLALGYWPRLSADMAMSIGSERRPEWVQARHWQRLCEAVGLNAAPVAAPRPATGGDGGILHRRTSARTRAFAKRLRSGASARRCASAATGSSGDWPHGGRHESSSRNSFRGTDMPSTSVRRGGGTPKAMPSTTIVPARCLPPTCSPGCGKRSRARLGASTKSHGAAAETTMLDRLRKQIDERGTLDVLRHGVELLGLRRPLAMSQLKPALAMNPVLQARYATNRLRVARQVRYSLHNENAIDLALFLNGIPVATVELNSDFTQSVDDAVDQYRFDRNPKPKGQGDAEPLLDFPARRARSFRGKPERSAHMTTHLSRTRRRTSCSSTSATMAVPAIRCAKVSARRTCGSRSGNATAGSKSSVVISSRRATRKSR